MQGDLRLDSNQLQAARQIWKQVSAALVKLEAERAEILSQIYVNDAQMLGLQGAHMQVRLLATATSIATSSDLR